MICNQNKFIFNHQGKSAGSSITNALSFLVPAETNKMYKEGAKHLSLIEQVEIVRSMGFDSEDYFKFTTVRNPWDRQISWYYHWMKVTESYMDFNEWILKSEKARLFYSNLESMDYIIRFENLDSDWKEVCEILHFKHIELSIIDHDTKRPTRGYQTYYNQYSIDIVHERNKDIINKFGYNF